VHYLDLGVGSSLQPYESTWATQRRWHGDVADGRAPHTVLLVEHESVYTAGRRTAKADRPTDGTPVIDVDRGGRITWHGPGQLVGYPNVALASPIDVVAYVRALEQALIGVCAELGLTAVRVADRSGVWFAPDETTGRRARKVAAIGVRVSRGVTMHGFALNCCPDLTAFDRIVPCGISDADVTSLTAETGQTVTVRAAVPLVRRHLDAALTGLLADPWPAGAPVVELQDRAEAASSAPI
jgi:lipoyl(octanoyl) transferase